MLISVAMTIMFIYIYIPDGQYSFNGHVDNLSQDVLSFTSSLPRLPSHGRIGPRMLPFTSIFY